MPKATFELRNGTKIVIEGSIEEVEKLLSFYETKEDEGPDSKTSTRKVVREKESEKHLRVDLTKIVELIKNSQDADAFAEHILDRSSTVDRILLPLYVVYTHKNNSFGLTSGEIGKITKDLGVPISMANVAHAFSGSASRYVIGDQIRKKGIAVRYRLSRKGFLYIKSIIENKANANKK